MQDARSEFTVEVRGEPEAWLQVCEQLRTGRAAEYAAREVLSEVRLACTHTIIDLHMRINTNYNTTRSVIVL